MKISFVGWLSVGLAAVFLVGSPQRRAWATPPPPPVTPNAAWFRDFSEPLAPPFLAMGLQFRRFSPSPTFRSSVEGGVLTLRDPVLPRERSAEDGTGKASVTGASSAFAADFSQIFDDVQISGIVNPLGLPPIPISDDPELQITGENNLGFLARGNLMNMSTYVGGINFLDGTLIITRVDGGMLWSAFKAQSGDQPRLGDLFTDYKTRSYFLEFEVQTLREVPQPMPLPPTDTTTITTPPPPPLTIVPTVPAGCLSDRYSNLGTVLPGDVLLQARLYDAPGGNELLSVCWVNTYSPFHSGVAGVFVQSFDHNWGNPTGFPALFGSFDDVRAVVPEPATWTLATTAVLFVFILARRRRV